MGRFTNKVAIVTGGASGIGAAVVRQLSAEGAHVIIADIREDDGETLARELGDTVLFQKTDVSDESDWELLVQNAESAFGGVDILVSNAGALLVQTISGQSKAEVERVIAVNLMAAFIGTRIVTQAMVRRGAGTIVYTCSTLGMVVHNGFSAYAASKWGLRGFAKVAALELAPQGIRVNTVFPGTVNTPWTNPGGDEAAVVDRYCVGQPIPRAGRDAEVAHAILFAVDDASSYLVGAELVVDGGATAGTYNVHLPGAPAL